MRYLTWCLLIVCGLLSWSISAVPLKKHVKHKHHKHRNHHKVQTKPKGFNISLHDDTGNAIANEGEHAQLMDLLGVPIGDVSAAKPVSGELKTTTVHKLCSGKNATNVKNETQVDNSTIVYDKVICGNFTKQDLYDMHSRHAAQVLDYKGPITEHTLNKQRAELVKAVNLMAKFAGPLPSLRVKKN